MKVPNQVTTLDQIESADNKPDEGDLESGVVVTRTIDHFGDTQTRNRED